MNLSIRHWLTENHIEASQIQAFSPGQIAGVAFRIAQDMEVKSLIPFDVCPLVEVLELPLGAVEPEMMAIAELTAGLLRSFSHKKPLKRNEGTWLAFQIAYLRGLRQVLEQELSLHRVWLDRAMVFSPASVRPLSDVQLQAFLKTLSPSKITDTQAEQALSQVSNSLLVQQINNAAVAWFIANGAEEGEAKLITQRLNHSLYGHLLAVIAENAAPLAQLQKFVGLAVRDVSSTAVGKVGMGNSSTSVNTPTADKIFLCRERYRASLLTSQSEPLFTEYFALKDIYIPLRGVPEEAQNTAVDLITWVQQQDEKAIAVIESAAGYGKTSFCQTWAAHIAQHLYPHWMPIYIRLRDITYGSSLTDTLNSAFTGSSLTDLATWLELDHPPCILILDGWDELPPSGYGERAKVVFLQQLQALQSQLRHKILITSRLGDLNAICAEISLPVRRITIQPLEPDELKNWFQQWTKIQSISIAQNFFLFLKQGGIFLANSRFPQISTLVRQPLMLFFLGVLHRDGLLDEEIFQIVLARQHQSSAALLWEIYQRLTRWLLGYPQTGGASTMLMRPGCSHIHRTPEAIANLLQNQHPQEIFTQMQAVALAILQSHTHSIQVAEGTSLPPFYFRSLVFEQVSHIFPRHQVRTKNELIKTEFAHALLGEYLCAQAIIHHLKQLTQLRFNSYSEEVFLIDAPGEFAQRLYNLLGYGVLSPQILALITEGLYQEKNSPSLLQLLSQQLLPFWYAHCRSRWLDEGMAHNAWRSFQSQRNSLNIEQINAAVGLNVFMILCVIHQQIKQPFYPCGMPEKVTEFHPQALSILITKILIFPNQNSVSQTLYQCLSYLQLPKISLSQVALNYANLQHSNLTNADLRDTNLVGANLEKAQLINANLVGVNLRGANLHQANLSGANLSYANLAEANLNTTNLTNACLFQVIIDDKNRETTILNGAIFDLEQYQTIKQLLSQPSERNLPENTDNALTWVNTQGMGIMESVEGEASSDIGIDAEAESATSDYADDETVFG
ncbi:pentapeptide repeat-containing protein [Calothrix sp. 336/3]|uniref:pentapeptide repeat-containing protein n=1 Tax=Calothrix sp. 336/3 TaxID=1337936 RepID=UPI0004E3B43A|nr:pentapeptide repeat-containing protein [Calothrix sp. 336/3]AKG22285.1 pentapeptide repeat-containing protein [Calothrix sp. 336/3]